MVEMTAIDDGALSPRALALIDEMRKFDADKHPRGQHGRFASKDGGGHPDVAAQHARARKIIAAAPEHVRFGGGAPHALEARFIAHGPSVARRSDIRTSSVTRLGAKLRGLPADYTGSKDKERPADGFAVVTLNHRIPPGMPAHEHQARLERYGNIVKNARKEVLAQAEKARPPKKHVYLKPSEPASGGVARWRMKPELYPEGTTRSTLNRAYNHAALIALHDHGVVHYDAKMSDALKAEMKPVEPFIRYVHRELTNRLAIGNKAIGSSSYAEREPYRQAFGVPFKTPKHDKATGKERKRLRVDERLVKGTFGLGRAGGEELGRHFGAHAHRALRSPVHFGRDVIREAGRFGAAVAGGAAKEMGASPRTVRRAQHVGAVVGAGKLAAEGAALVYEPVHKLRQWGERRKRKQAAAAG